MWTGDNANQEHNVDTSKLNYALVVHAMLETLPNIVIQWYNNSLIGGGGWGQSEAYSTVSSFLMLGNEVYRIIFFKFFQGKRVLKV